MSTNSNLFLYYGDKVKNIDEIIKITGQYPRKKKLALCHGVFDVMHPGHLTHFLEIKKKL